MATCRFERIDICNEPCIKDIQKKLDELSEEDIGDKLQDIIDTLQNNNSGGNNDNQSLDFVNIEVPVITVDADGTMHETTATVPAIKGTENQIIGIFTELANLKRRNREDNSQLQRIYSILGGSSWFSGEAEEPSLEISVESVVKQKVTDGGIDADAEKAITAHNLLDLIAAYQAPTYGRLGLTELPGNVPQSLLAYSDSQGAKSIKTYVELFEWFIHQFDALVGKFPIEIEIEDIDPTTQGNQTKKVELPNISEALAEMYGLNITSSTNSDISINFFMRLAAEIIAVKNATLITQDYVKANAQFMGYRGNPKKREITYAFDPAHLDSLEQILKESKQYIVGWEEVEKDSLMEYLHKLMFSAGIIKAAFFRNKNQLNQIRDEMTRMINDGQLNDDEAWRRFVDEINNENTQFNKGDNPRPKIKDNLAPPPPTPPSTSA